MVYKLHPGCSFIMNIMNKWNNIKGNYNKNKIKYRLKKKTIPIQSDNSKYLVNT